MKTLPSMNLLSPVKWPPAVGTLAITLCHPRGYVVVVRGIMGPAAEVCYLDDSDSFTLPLDMLIPTGKTPEDLCTTYTLPVLEWDAAVDQELSFPDFTQVGKKKSTSAKAKKVSNKQSPAQLAQTIKNLTDDQKDKIRQLLLDAFKK